MAAESSEQFQPTRWAVVLSLREKGNEENTHRVLDTLCHDYWYPLYAFARRRGYTEHDAQDFTQGFFGYLLEKDLFSLADPARGKLRTFLLTAFTRYISKENKSLHAQKRGGGMRIESLDEEIAEGDHRYQREHADACTPELLFARSWAQTILEKSRAELKKREAEAGREKMLHVLEPFLEGTPEASLSYESVAKKLGMTQVTVRKNVSRLRERYRQIVRQEIAETLENPTEEAIEAEIRSLWAALNAR
jgi:RNA polymerase sigma-70 factor (ECF subfamily)